MPMKWAIWTDNRGPDRALRTQKISRSSSKQTFLAQFLLLVLSALALPGCGGGGEAARTDAEAWRPTAEPRPSARARPADEQASLESLRTEMAQVFDEAQPTSGSAALDGPAESGWSIALGAFSGEGHRQRAEAALARIRSELGLREARLQARDTGTAIVMGRYEGPGSREAQRDLARVRAVEVDGLRPFAGAFLSPAPRRENPGSNPAHNLANARREFGASARYTLQIGVYESPDVAESRRAAERAAAELRREGEPAFYYHGDSRSMVTVGAFSERDAGARDGVASPVLLELQRRHPYNLMNGNRTIVERGGDGVERTQKSFLVEIPQVSTRAR